MFRFRVLGLGFYLFKVLGFRVLIMAIGRRGLFISLPGL
jgi:hypothetical protein